LKQIKKKGRGGACFGPGRLRVPVPKSRIIHRAVRARLNNNGSVLAEILRLQGDANLPTRNIFSNPIIAPPSVPVNSNETASVKVSGFGPIRPFVWLKFGVGDGRHIPGGNATA
jgi:hypothetical protein